MKIQCSCGTKYAFDATPEMLQNPVKFVCPNCSLDSSEFVNELIRQEFAGQTPPPPAVVPRLKIAHTETPAAQPQAAPVVSELCSRHRGVPATEKCAICQKPICPQCLELFGYFCSPLCKGKAEAQNVAVPVFAGRKDRVEARFWRKAGLIFGLLATTLILAVGFWVWYAWFGSVPHPVFSVRFADDDRAYSGRSQLVGKDQIVFLHGGTLARYDLKTKKQIWSQELVTKQQIADVVKAENAAEARLDAENSGGYRHRRSVEDIEKSAKQILDAELSLRVSGQDIWMAQAAKLTHYDWGSGKALRVITLPERGSELVQKGDEMLLFGAQSITHVSLANGDSRVERFGAPGAATVANAQNSTGGGLPSAGTDNGQPLDPQKTEAQAQNLNLPARIALPALLGNAAYEQRLEAELKDGSQPVRHKNNGASPQTGAESLQLIPGENSFAEFSTRLLEARLVTRSAMKAPTGKSVLDSGNVGVMNETAAVNEQLNEMQRNRGGDTITENESRYQVTVHLPGSANTPDWTGEVVGPPQLFVLKTVNVVAAGKTVIVLDKSNKKLWQTTLTYNLPAGEGGFAGEASKFGAGPCVEHGDTLYVFDQAVLGAFDPATGNAHWRLPSVGVVGLFFDDQNDVYVNTTTGNPDDIKYARQIDVTRKTEAVVFKIDSKTGKILWRIKPDGYISYLLGKFIYTERSYDPDPDDTQPENDLTSVLQKKPYLCIARIQPSDGRILWENTQSRCPLNINFDGTSIALVFKREVQVLRYLSF